MENEAKNIPDTERLHRARNFADICQEERCPQWREICPWDLFNSPFANTLDKRAFKCANCDATHWLDVFDFVDARDGRGAGSRILEA